MEFTVNGHNLSVSDRFYDYASEKVDKLDHLKDKIQRIEAKVTKEKNPKISDTALTVELTVVSKGPAIRSEAKAGDKFAAFDIAFNKLLEQLRRAKDRRKVHHGRHTPRGVSEATAALDVVPPGEPSAAAERDGDSGYSTEQDLPAGDSPVMIRRKVFPAATMSADDAVDNMELVGHDFYLFVDAETNAPSVVYRRRGWTYGVITLDADCADTESAPAPKIQAYHSDDRAATA